jgi:membrane protease YdiL (CAAX protease family)
LGKHPFLRSIGCEWPSRTWRWLSVVLGVVLFGAAVVITKLVGADKPTQLEQIVNSSLAARYAIALLAVFTAPFIEEFIYRGVLFAALQRLTGVVIAGITTLALFTLIHVPQYWPILGVLAAVGFLSVALTVVRAKSGRLLPCIVIHFVFNGIQSVILLVEPYLPSTTPLPDPAPTLILLLRIGLF